MVHNLYRLYLYIVSIALLIFAAFAVGRLLNTLLTFTPLHGTDGYTPQTSSEVVQSLVFAGVALAIAGALGGLHYWLIRRDMQNDPAAATSAIRSFFLNMTEAIGIVLAVPVAGFLVFGILVSSQSSDVVGAAAFALATLLLVMVLELAPRLDAGSPNHQWHVQGGFVGEQAVRQLAVLAKTLTVVRGEHDQRWRFSACTSMVCRCCCSSF